jgi:hypothetical protein
MELVVTTAVPDIRRRGVPNPATLDTVAVTLAVVSNWKPTGAFNTIVPAWMSRFAPSFRAGPVNTTDVPAEVSAEILALA